MEGNAVTILDRDQAADRAATSQTNVPGTCQLWTRTQYLAPSAGDRDADGDADAVDGWKSEPPHARHTDRHPPRGVPVAWSGGRNGYGHRAISLGGGLIRTTDGNGPGRVATRELGWVERTWGLTYLGWSETITGIPIPRPPRPEPEPVPPPAVDRGPKTRGTRIDQAVRRLRHVKATGQRKTLADRALEILLRIPTFRRRVK
jgi:hypothetical protein